MDAWPGRLTPDRSLRVLDGGRVLIGGSPLTVLRYADPIDLDTCRTPEVVARLVDLGMVHPQPESGPYGADDVTIVIPAHEDADALADTLASLATVGEDPPTTSVREVIVVDDGSADAAPIAASVASAASSAGIPPVRLIRRSRNGGPAAARNLGLFEVGTPLVAFLDAGCTLEPTWLDALLPHFADPTLGLVAPRVVSGGPTARATPPRRPPGFTRRIMRTIAAYETERSPLDLGGEPARVAPRTRVSYVPTACVVARVEALQAVGGFDAAMRVGEDVDLVWRLTSTTPPWRVRFAPSARVRSDARTRPWSWLARRIDYGTSAAPLARRHPGALAPATVSPWSAAAWGLVAVGRPAAGVAIGAASTALLARKLQNLPDPWREAVLLAGTGNLAAGRLLADALRRAWWPAAGLVILFGPRPLRRTAVAAFVLPPALEWVTTRPPVDPASWIVLRTADDLAYGIGVWIGCWRARTVAPLVPDLGR